MYTKTYHHRAHRSINDKCPVAMGFQDWIWNGKYKHWHQNRENQWDALKADFDSFHAYHDSKCDSCKAYCAQQLINEYAEFVINHGRQYALNSHCAQSAPTFYMFRLGTLTVETSDEEPLDVYLSRRGHKDPMMEGPLEVWPITDSAKREFLNVWIGTTPEFIDVSAGPNHTMDVTRFTPEEQAKSLRRHERHGDEFHNEQRYKERSTPPEKPFEPKRR